MAKGVCSVCGELLKEGTITEAGKKFCSQACKNKKKVCEFC